MKENYKKAAKIISCLAETELEKEEEIFLLDETIKDLEKNRCILVGEKPSIFRRNKIIRLKAEGSVQSEIAKRVKVSKQYVSKVLKNVEDLNLIQELSRARIGDFS